MHALDPSDCLNTRRAMAAIDSMVTNTTAAGTMRLGYTVANVAAATVPIAGVIHVLR